MANNTTKTPTQQKNSLKRASRLCLGGEILSVLAPYFTIGIINYEKYFIQYDGTRISLGFAIAMVIMGITVYLVAEKQFNFSYVALFISYGVVCGVFFLIREILNDIVMIMFFGWVGLGGALGLNIGKTQIDKKVTLITDAIEQAKKDNYSEAYKKELADKEKKKNEKKVKF